MEWPERYSKLADCTGQATIAGIDVALASLDDLITMKQAIHRPKDIEDLRRLTDLRDQLASSGRPDEQPEGR